ncbi:MAG: twitching motility protein PilT [Candidatus Aminicenantes bacterium RBG_19FT_COMBO_58_17]|jgi:tRNA(fMet)-specific endonuclease VapC|nr:MAG: twitching motility protein PilT [Candidatus Aminicenantes bacterium RBG_19FT_COMBO_58_17]
MRKILLDTNAYVRFLRGDEKVMTYLAQADSVCVSVFVLGELYAGFRAGGKERNNRQILERFLLKPTVTVLEATIETADIFGLIMASLKKSGNPIPINDLWIAAHALETGSILLTYDHHFAVVPGLRLWDEFSLP